MTPNTTAATTIDQYITTFPTEVQALLTAMRQTIQAAAPTATEKISYGMPTFYLNGNLVHFAAYKHHIGFYPAPSGVVIFADEIAPFKHSKGTLQFPLDKPLPLDLVDRIVRYRVGEQSK